MWRGLVAPLNIIKYIKIVKQHTRALEVFLLFNDKKMSKVEQAQGLFLHGWLLLTSGL